VAVCDKINQSKILLAFPWLRRIMYDLYLLDPFFKKQTEENANHESESVPPLNTLSADRHTHTLILLPHGFAQPGLPGFCQRARWVDLLSAENLLPFCRAEQKY
jgi:hypothetical protein